MKNYEQEIKDWKRLVEKMRGNLNIYIRIKPILQPDIDKLIGIESNSEYKFKFNIVNSSLK